jgi:hypothetical protein
MIKKMTLSSLTVLSLLTVSAYAQGATGGKCGAVMMGQPKAQMGSKKQMKKKRNSPFLIKHGLPHMTKMLMKYWDDPKLALTPEQKKKLMVVRKETLGSIMDIKPKVVQLKREIIQSSKTGVKADALKEKVEQLAALKAEATMTHLKCIENTRSVLTKEQMAYLMELKRQYKMQRKQQKN